MPLIPYHPFRDLEEWFHDEWPNLLGRDLVQAPKVNVYQTDKEVVVEVELPGVKPENIDVEIEDDRVKIEAKIEEKKEEKEKGYFRREISRGSYRRILTLPSEVDEARAVADYQEGVLKITAPKVEPTKKEAKKVKVKTRT